MICKTVHFGIKRVRYASSSIVFAQPVEKNLTAHNIETHSWSSFGCLEGDDMTAMLRVDVGFDLVLGAQQESKRAKAKF